MSRLTAIEPETATGAAAEIFAKIRRAIGRVPNAYATIGTQSPEALGALLSTEAVIAAGTLTKADVETVKLVVSAVAGCDYCVAAHRLAGKAAGLTRFEIQQVLAGALTGDEKRDVLVHYVAMLVTTHGTVPRSEVDAMLEAGYTERQLIEIALAMASISFTNLVNRVNDTTIDFPALAD